MKLYSQQGWQVTLQPFVLFSAACNPSRRTTASLFANPPLPFGQPKIRCSLSGVWHDWFDV